MRKINKNILNTIAVFGAIAALTVSLIIILHRMSYPFGWDVGYYMQQTLRLEHGSVISPRLGYILISAVFHKITPLSLLQVNLYLPLFLLHLLAALLGYLAYKTTRSLFVFLITAVVSILSGSYLYLAVSLFDNLLAIVLFVLLLIQLSDNDYFKQLWRQLVSIVLLIGILFTHVETFFFTLVSIFFILVLNVISNPRLSFERAWKKKWVILIALITIIIGWLPFEYQIIQVFKAYLTPPTVVDSSITYATNNGNGLWYQVMNIGRYLSSFFNVSLLGTLNILGLIVLLKNKNNKNANRVVISWVSASILLVVYSVLRRSIPIDRAMTFIPMTVLFGIGISAILSRAKRVVPIVLSILLLVIYIPNYIVQVKSYPHAISQEDIHSFAMLRDYVKTLTLNQQRSVVLVTNIPSYETAANAYQGLWSYWAAANLLFIPNLQYCVYFGEYSAYASGGLISERSDQPDYNRVNERTAQCVRSLTYDRVTVAIRTFLDTPTFQQLEQLPTTVKVTNDLLVIH